MRQHVDERRPLGPLEAQHVPQVAPPVAVLAGAVVLVAVHDGVGGGHFLRGQDPRDDDVLEPTRSHSVCQSVHSLRPEPPGPTNGVHQPTAGPH